ncbi:MAG: protein translocase SEC61 complex subunit gamma [Candidatus Lokiarchaeota archaeon]|nr:protein translocase SEC61 complex subunit gamma [Candidatus Lokiarchaeota archaeon]
MSSYPKYAKYEKYKEKKKPGLYQRFKTFLKNAKRVLKIANKPGRKEYLLVFKICGIGLVVLGVLSYVIQLIFSVALPIGD